VVCILILEGDCSVVYILILEGTVQWCILILGGGDCTVVYILILEESFP